MAQAALTQSSAVAVRPQAHYGAWGLRAAALSYLIVMIVIPLFVINVEGLRSGLDKFWASITGTGVLNAVWLSVWTAAVMASINIVMGTLTAYVLVRYRFPGKNLLNALIDLPFAVPTLVTGVMLVLLYGPQTPIGSFVQTQFGFRILFAPPGIILALLFISYPFVVRAVQPVLLSLDMNQEEAAYTLGASPWRTFKSIIFPAIRPAILTGGLLSFARALGEFGAIVIVSGNIPMKTQTAAVYIFSKVEGGDMTAASGISVILLLIAFGVTLAVDFMQRRNDHA